MAYIGNNLQVAFESYQNIDDISSSFDGSTTSFALQVGGVAPTPFPKLEQNVLISVGGVIQKPDSGGTTGFKFTGTNIVFSSAPATSESFFGVILAGADYVNAGTNFPVGAVGTPSVTFKDDEDTGLYHPSANTVSVTTGGTERATFASNGRVGIGVTSPNRTLDIQSATNDNGFSLNCIGTPANYFFDIRDDDSVVSRLDNAGNLGIGEGTPDVRLHVTETFNTAYTVDNATTESNNLVKLENPSSTANAFAGIAFRTGSGADMYFGSIQQSGNDGDFYFANQNSANKELLRIKSTGDVNIVDGNLIIGTSGHGIDFSATADSGGTVASELLADYEIGTWTPQLGGSGNSFTYHADCGGSYIKVGQLVTLLGAIRLTARSGSSQLTLHNFPFTVGDVSSGDSNHEGGVVTHYTDNSASGTHGPLGHCTSGSGSVSLSHQLSSGNGSALNADEIDTTFVWRFMVTYPSA